MTTIVLYNPHVDDFLAAPPHFRALRRRPLKKYGFFIEQHLAAHNKVHVLVDSSLSAFIPSRIFSKLPKAIRQTVALLEFHYWKRINKFNDEKIIKIDRSFDFKNSILIAFSYKAAGDGFKLRHNQLAAFGHVIFHLSHYFASTKQKADNIRSLENAVLAGDSDITDNIYFKKFFGWYQKPFLIFPFSVSSRFVARVPFAERKKTCVATGTFHYLENETPSYKYTDYIHTSGHLTYHPIRRAIYENRHELTGLIACHTTPYKAHGNAGLIKRLFSIFHVSQRRYFSIDIVSLYNEYQYAVVGEEQVGFPALGALEAIACGCILIAQPDFYKGLGLLPYVHFLPYNGTLDDLKNTLHQAMNHNLNEIALNGRLHVQSFFSPDAMYRRWIDQINSLQPRAKRPEEN